MERSQVTSSPQKIIKRFPLFFSQTRDSTTTAATTTTSDSFPSIYFLLLGFDPRLHFHHSQNYSFHRSFFTRAKPAQIIY
ncbi:hypothetical protein P8452_37741 [Trifolium repens]|nr:hypothetical protein P8452_37741 [Trifolium repens]